MGEPVVDDGIAVLLDSLSDPAVNRHVIFNLLDLIAYRLHLTQLI
jgi:hypothetical protein